MSRDSRNIWPTLIMCTALLSIGGVVGFFLRPIILPASAMTEAEPDEMDSGGGATDIVTINETTLEHTELPIGKFEVRDYYKSVRIPAQIVERIPQSRRNVSAPIAGVVTKVYVAKGQAVRPGEKLFDLRITDESISKSQVELLKIFSDLEIERAKKERLVNLGEGVVAGKQLLQVDFGIKKLTQQRSALIQELRVRGMNDDKIMTFIKTKQLAQGLSIFAPSLEETDQNDTEPNASSMRLTPASARINGSTRTNASTRSNASVTTALAKDLADNQYFTVETIVATEGSSLELGESLCELTHHNELLIKGLAFEGDVDRIANANQNGWTFTAQFGDGPDALVREGLKLFSVENHVDMESQTFPIFVEIQNEIINQTTDRKNRTYVNWRFKPGQRAHVEIPIELLEKQVIIPIGALVREGAETFVFLKISHTHTEADGTVLHEFQKTPVKVLHTDRQFAVVAKNVRLDIYENYALDQAVLLNLALKQAAGGGGGHGHDHPHPH